MKRLFFFLCFLWAAIGLSAQDSVRTYTLENVPNIHIQDRRFYVTDPSGILSFSATDSINSVCRLLETQTGIETAVVLLPSIGGEDPFDFGYRLFRKWGLGKKKNNNGLLVLFVLDQRKVRFITGYGLEGDLPDALCKRIQQQYMVPAFRKKDYNTGMVQGTLAIYNTLKDSMKPDSSANKGEISLWNYVFLVIVILLFILIPYLMRRRQERCPKCGKHSLKRTSSQVSVMNNGHRWQMTVYKCSHCGYTITRNKDLDDDGDDRNSGMGPFMGGFLGGTLLGGGFGRGGSGGGFEGGGSFGGGDTGGGGAGSDW